MLGGAERLAVWIGVGFDDAVEVMMVVFLGVCCGGGGGVAGGLGLL